VRTLGDRMIALGRLAAIFVMAGLGGCASVISGTSQTLTLDTVPSGADCSLSRKGLVIGRVNPTPGAVYVQRTHDDITVTCTKDGYKTGSFLNKSGLEAATLGNIILGGLIGVAVDAASGANNKYDEKVRIVLAPTDETLRATSPPDGALAPTADFRCPAAGTVIRNSTGGQLTFTEANDSRCGYTDETGQKHERYAIFADGYGRLARKEMDGLWPLKVGNIVSFHIHDSSSVQTSDRYFVRDLDETFAVGRQERITVPAGTFDTFVVDWTEQETGPNPTGASTTLWYAPSVGYVVKSSVHMLNNNEVSSVSAARYVGMTYDAVEIAMPNGAPVPVATTEPVAPTPVSASKPAAAASPAAATAPPPAAAPPARAATPAATDAAGSPADRLKALQQLLDEKLITPEEYDRRRKVILDSL
jgi:hypothetical protein